MTAIDRDQARALLARQRQRAQLKAMAATARAIKTAEDADDDAPRVSLSLVDFSNAALTTVPPVVPPRTVLPAPGSAAVTVAMTPLETVLAALEAHGCEKGSGQDHQCPAHDDEQASLGVTAGDKVPVLLKCQAGCKPGKIVKALGLEWSEVMGGKPSVLESAAYTYTDADGNPVLTVVRQDLADGKKSFSQRSLVHGKSVKEIPKPLWQLPAVLATARGGGNVWICEGEKSVIALNPFLPDTDMATTAPGGASQPWTTSMSESLIGCAMVHVIADNDLAGWLRARNVARSLREHDIPHMVWRSATDGAHDDIVEHLAAGYKASELRRLLPSEIRAAQAEAEGQGAISVDRYWPAPNEQWECASQLIERLYTTDGSCVLRYWRSDFYSWGGAHWSRYSLDSLNAAVWQALAEASYLDAAGDPKPWRPTEARVRGVLAALRGHNEVYREPDDEPDRVVAFTNGNLDVNSRTLSAATPSLFNLSSLPYAYSSTASPPERWLTFLTQLWKDDYESVLLLREWFGYVLSGDTSLHKMLFLAGPPRSGKSTIVDVLTAMIGTSNAVSQSLDKIARQFALVPYIGKTLATPGDVRLSGTKDHSQIVSTLLGIVGDDDVEIERKGKDDRWHGKLGVRFMLVGNEIPPMRDDSSALASRWRILETNEGFEHREDRSLKAKLLAELPGILLWALDGYDSLRARGEFVTVKSTAEAAENARESNSPVLRFVNACIEYVDGSELALPTAYDRYRLWADQEGIRNPGERQAFGQKLAVVLRLQRQIPRRRIDGVMTTLYGDVRLRRRTIDVTADADSGIAENKEES